MGLVVSEVSTQSNFKRVPSGNHVARCFGITDMGTHLRSGQYGDKLQHQIRLDFEVFGDDDDDLTYEVDGVIKPLTISKNFTMSLHEKSALRKELSTWRGRDFTVEELAGFDIRNVIGVYCMINVIVDKADNGKEYSNIKGISPLHKSMVKPEPVHHNRIFDLDSPDVAVLESLPSFLQDIIRDSPEWIKFAKSSQYDDSAIPNVLDSYTDNIEF